MIDNKKLLLESAKHWRKDILEPLEAGRIIREKDAANNWTWDDGRDEVEMYGSSCPLCIEYEFCSPCPLGENFGNTCGANGTTWDNFRKNPTTENAQAMVDLLEKLARECDQK